MAFLCPLLLWGEGEESPQLSRPSSAAPKLYTGHRGHPATKSPLPLPPWLLLWRWELVHPSQPRPCGPALRAASGLQPSSCSL